MFKVTIFIFYGFKMKIKLHKVIVLFVIFIIVLLEEWKEYYENHMTFVRERYIKKMETF